MYYNVSHAINWRQQNNQQLNSEKTNNTDKSYLFGTIPNLYSAHRPFIENAKVLS